MTAPRFQSKKIPGLVMWPNGAIVRVEVDDDGVITRNRLPHHGGVEVLVSYGRVNLAGLEMREFGLRSDPEVRKSLDEKAFELVEQYEEQKRRNLMGNVLQTLSLVIVRAAKKRTKDLP